MRWTGPTGAHPAPRLTLLPAAVGGGYGHAGHGGAAATPSAASGGAGTSGSGGPGAAGEQPGGADTAGKRTGGAGAAGADGFGDAAGWAGGNADALLAAGLLAGLGVGTTLGWFASRWRRRSGSAQHRSGPTLKLIHSSSGRSG
ncbi:hypothetical protein [Micromonospora sp. NPDC005367]|uniref:hypothetical protein n=1 Tax=Micromonospora sp. NPDC005367 TaxID=3155590 RepID=UPI0033AE8618